MNKTATLKRLFNNYTRKFIRKIALAVFFSLLVAISTSSIAWLLDPAIEKIFIQKDQSLLIIIPFLIIIAFATKGVSLYVAKVIMINVGEDVKKKLQFDMLNTLIVRILSRLMKNIQENLYQILPMMLCILQAFLVMGFLIFLKIA